MGQAQDNYLAFMARQDTAAGSGGLVLYWPNAPGGGRGCSSNTSWPILDAITILGVDHVDPTSVTVLVSALKSAAAVSCLVTWRICLPEPAHQRSFRPSSTFCENTCQ